MDISGVKSQFQIIGSRVISLCMDNKMFDADDNGGAPIHIDLSHKITISDYANKDRLIGSAILNVELNIGEDNSLFHLIMSLEGGFSAPKGDIEVDVFEKMIGINGISSLYSIARATIASITAQTFLSGSIVLPMVNVLQYSKNISDSVQVNS